MPGDMAMEVCRRDYAIQPQIIRRLSSQRQIGIQSITLNGTPRGNLRGSG